MENKRQKKQKKSTHVNIKDIITCYISPLGSIVVAIAIGVSGFLGSSYLREKAAARAHTEKGYLTVEALRIYSELMSKREEADNVLREDMFRSIIKSFSAAEKVSIEELLLNLRLLAYNFNETFNIKPFFLLLLNKKLIPYDGPNDEYLEDLENIACYIITKQLWVLEEGGVCFFRTIDLDLINQNQACLLLKDETRTLEGIERNFRIAALEVNKEKKEIKFRLEIRTPKGPDHELDIRVVELWVGLFDFPMIDNIRISHNQRCAMVLNHLSETTADVTFVVFPGALAGIIEKPYYQEAVQNILETGNFLKEEGFEKSWSLK
ncbi:MAG: hypothetical protein E3K32_13015 [wastewater metagenome]|nr:hypothetical protein [Candidatus Loosdrechtia aerotolerans]